MRRVFLLYFLWVICLITPGIGRAERPWGALKDFVNDRTHQYAMDFFIQGQPIRYAVDKEVTQEEKDIFVANFQKWPQETLKAIEKAGRQKEFKDILPLLRRPLVLEETDQNPNIILSLGEDGVCGDYADGCFSRAQNNAGVARIIVVKSDRDRFDHITLHEIGHYFGLGDQYEKARGNSHVEYSSAPYLGAVMLTAFNLSLSFDDIDGFINVLDLRLAQYNGGRFSERAQKGWKTLGSEGTNFYQESRTPNRKKIDSADYWGRGSNVLIFYQQGRVFAHMEPPDGAQLFDVAESTVIRDPNTGLISSITTLLDMTGVKEIYSLHLIPKGARWTRTFTYGEKHTLHIGDTKIDSLTIQISEEINEIPFRKFEARIYSSGSVEMRRIIDQTEVSVTISPYKMWDFGPLEDMIGASSYTLHETVKTRQVDPNTYVEKMKNIEVDFVIKNGKVKSVSSKEPQANLEEICRPNIRRIESFYENFYKPLFGFQTDKEQKQQIMENINKQINRQSVGSLKF
ncbi:MAG: hypothetical protein J6V32_02230 [Elusimicrobiaceae bacterium]|nr:hypothetical protein [Elusimicrobiaceae bacterium]